MKSFDIDFVVIGGFAKYLHGVEDNFKDIDLFISKKSNTSENIIRFLKSFNANFKMSKYEFDDILRIRMGGIQVDILPRLHGLEDERVHDNIVTKKYDSEHVKVLSLKDIETNIQTVKQLITKNEV